MPQLTYDYSMPAGYPGLRADTDNYRARTYIAAAALAYGLGVVLGAGGKAALPGASTDKFLGVVMHEGREKAQGTGTSQFAAGDPLAVMSQGPVFVKVEEAVADGDPVFVRFAANGANTTLGAFRKSADNPGAGATAVQVPQAVYRSAASAGGLAVLELNLP
jgi:hypothetical protein